MGIEIKQGAAGAALTLSGDRSGNTAMYVDDQGGTTTSGTKITSELYFQVQRVQPPGTFMGNLPPGAVPVQVQYFSPTTTNSGSTSNIVIGVDTTTNYFLSATDVKASTGLGWQTPIPPSVLNTMFVQLATTGLGHPVTAGYAETGTSTSGGPWSCSISYYVP